MIVMIVVIIMKICKFSDFSLEKLLDVGMVNFILDGLFFDMMFVF